jgi:DNA-binding SARP family transcriptional activator
MARGALEAAIGYAVRAAAMSPLDENHQALLIRLYRMAGDEDAAARQFAACAKALRAELGVAPGPAVQAAMRQPWSAPDEVADEATIEAIVEAGSAAVSAGVVEAGVQSLRTAARLADGAGWPNPISGSTATSSTHSASSAGDTAIRIPAPGSRRCGTWPAGRG